MIRIHSRHDRHAHEMVHTVTDDDLEVCRIRVPEMASLGELASELAKADPFVAMAKQFAEEG